MLAENRNKILCKRYLKKNTFQFLALTSSSQNKEIVPIRFTMSAKVLKGQDLKFPVEHKNVGQFFFNLAEKHDAKICQVDGTSNKTETYKSVKLRSTRVAIALQKKGVTSNDVITFCSSNTIDNTIPILATFFLGAKVANLESSLSLRHTKHLLELATPKIVLVEESAVSLIEDSLKDTNLQTEIIVFGRSSKYATFSDLVQPQEDEENFKPSDVNPDEPALFFFSSGTTGLPKAICHTNYTFQVIVNQMFQTGVRNVVFHFSTFYWMTAILLLGCSFKAGSYRVFCRNPSAEDIFKIIEKYRVEYMFMAPVLTYALTNCKNAKNYDVSSVKYITLGGTPMAPAQLDKVAKLFENTLVGMGYGMSEIGIVSGFYAESDAELAKIKRGAAGKLAPNLQLKVVDVETRQLLGPNQKGEICIKSPSVMKGYYKMDSSGVFDEENFLKTGDVGYYDEDECIYVIQRIKEMFKYQSWHIIPSAIEAVLLEHPSVKEVVVFGIPHEIDGEVPAACVVLKEDENVTKDEIDQFLTERVADRERLRGGITFLQNLPKTPSGKVVRAEVKNFVMETYK